jgi:hypothetical protein
MRAQNLPTGKSLVEEDKIDLAADLLKQARERGVKLLLPIPTPAPVILIIFTFPLPGAVDAVDVPTELDQMKKSMPQSLRGPVAPVWRVAI